MYSEIRQSDKDINRPFNSPFMLWRILNGKVKRPIDPLTILTVLSLQCVGRLVFSIIQDSLFRQRSTGKKIDPTLAWLRSSH